MQQILQSLGIQQENKGVSTGNKWIESSGKMITSFSPVDGKEIAKVTSCDERAYEEAIKIAENAFMEWRKYPSPKRGEIVRQVGEALRKNKDAWVD
jgi:aldehyde dehydrogenase (NAD+)